MEINKKMYKKKFKNNNKNANKLKIIKILQKKNKNQDEKLSYQLIINKTIKKNFLTKEKEKSLYNGKKRGVNSFFRLSQAEIKNFFSFKELLGVLKSSW